MPSARPAPRPGSCSNRTKDLLVTDVPPSRRDARAAEQAQPTPPDPTPEQQPAPTEAHDPLGRLFTGPDVPEPRGRDDAAAFDPDARPKRRRAARATGGAKKRRSRRGLIGGLLAFGVFAALVAIAVTIFLEPVRGLFAEPEPTDFTGTGSSEVLFTIHQGDGGSDIANNLVSDGVIKSYDPFYDLLLAQSPEPVFQPGAYSLKAEMSAKAALSALLDSESTRLANTFVIPEGTALKEALPLIADGTGVALTDLEAAAADWGSFGLPAGATSLEGFLFPATYDIDPSTPAHDILKTLVDRMYQSLDQAGVPVDDRYRVVVFASLVQREARVAEDFPKVARVFQNRLDQGWRLQSDATVAYGTGATDRVSTTDAERNDAGNVYNTYQRDGLPPAPISNPGDVAIDAVMHPADGTWMYFVTVNLETGETVYSTTDAEHNAAVDQWQAWMRDHPEYQ
ncbi:endolytic transglycosylase MltG [Rathayibacter sp. AY1C6]|nr:endolytic transglycosylase MltG [Rathayibacter sp. AY1A3]PPG12335.1 endolytic transglycosylase MltG [Rathayibacter sp. AY1C6]PPH51262.1 endolytic transglycosylase MltG [Rathayibacter sp. AY1E2]PPI08963.1 endolytic transglycosylase MltG [Rathayibacter sp. AY1B8]PPI36618.1 endolytic transglycosylase MltG [Rathayibacter sp. RFBD1]PPI53884.1 endolytic transglycosylase MltG [Rathayibacter sp. TRS19]